MITIEDYVTLSSILDQYPLVDLVDLMKAIAIRAGGQQLTADQVASVKDRMARSGYSEAQSILAATETIFVIP